MNRWTRLQDVPVIAEDFSDDHYRTSVLGGYAEGGRLAVRWAGGWPRAWGARLEMLSSGGAEVARQLTDDSRWMQLNCDDGQVLYCTDNDVFFAALAECEMHVAAETDNPSQKAQLLCDAKAHITEAIKLNRYWDTSELAQMIDQNNIISSYSEIRKNARLLYQGDRSKDTTVLSILPDELLTKIAGLTGNPAAHSEAESENIAREYFCRPPVNTAEQVTPGCCAPVAKFFTRFKNSFPYFWPSNPTAHQRLSEEQSSSRTHRPNNHRYIGN